MYGAGDSGTTIPETMPGMCRSRATNHPPRVWHRRNEDRVPRRGGVEGVDPTPRVYLPAETAGFGHRIVACKQFLFIDLDDIPLNRETR